MVASDTSKSPSSQVILNGDLPISDECTLVGPVTVGLNNKVAGQFLMYQGSSIPNMNSMQLKAKE